MLPMDQFKALSDTSCDGVCQITRQALAGQEKLINLNIDAIQEFIEESGRQVGQTWDELAEMDPHTAWPLMLSNNMTCGAAINLLLLQISGRLHKDLMATTQAQLVALNNGVLNEVNKYTSVTRKMTAAAQANKYNERKYRLAA